jgi:Arc/MetJ-type ribon-helix-helix transcriptional regulator
MNPTGDDDCLCFSDDSAVCLCVGDTDEVGETLERGLRVAVAKAESMGEKGKAIKDAVDKAMVVVKGLDLEALRGDLKGRGNVVMTRVADEDLEVMDTLVEAGLFDSRSECAAFLIRAGIENRQDLVAKVEDTARKISKLKENLKEELS